MTGRASIGAARTKEDGGRADRLLSALTAFAATSSEAELSDLLDEVASAHFGAISAVLISRDPILVSAHRMARLTGGALSPSVQVCGTAIEQRMTGGAAIIIEAPRSDLSGIAVPPAAARAVLIPCGGEGSMNALCAFWAADALTPSAPVIERLRLLAAVSGLTFDRHISDLRDRLLRADLDNRIRNVLAVIRSVGTRSAERAASMEEFLLHYEGRIDAIGRSQIAAVRPGEISFELLLREELLAQGIQDEPNISLEGMDVSISSEQAEALGLAMHELAVNAVKFGSLTGPEGSLAVRWWVETAAGSLALNIDWRECCGPPAGPGRPARAGFGLTYLEHALPFQLNAEVTLKFPARGLRCQIAVPLKPAQDPHRNAPSGARDRSGRAAGLGRNPDFLRT